MYYPFFPFCIQLRPSRCCVTFLTTHRSLLDALQLLAACRHAPSRSLSSPVGTLLAFLVTRCPPCCSAFPWLPAFPWPISALLEKRRPLDLSAIRLLGALRTAWRPPRCLLPSLPYVAFLAVRHCLVARRSTDHSVPSWPSEVLLAT